MIRGTVTAMVTPFIRGAVDYDGLQENIQRQLEASVEGILLLGSTGESPTITDEERTAIIHLAVKLAKGKTHIMVGTGSNCTRKTIAYTVQAAESGADSALVVTPYYNCPTQEGIYRHFEAITNACDIPLGVYNIPKRTGSNIEVITLRQICQLPGIAFIKEESLFQLQELLEKIDPSILLFTGNDQLAFAAKALGAAGVISVASNLIPSTMQQMMQMELEAARKLHIELLPLFLALSHETNPIPIKEAMNLWDMSAGECRLPLCEMKNRALLIETLKKYEHLSSSLVL